MSAIQSLYENSIVDNSKKITSVHLLDASIDDEQVSFENQCNENNNSTSPYSGNTIENVVGKFYKGHVNF